MSKSHDYKGYNIYRTTQRRGAYNPWKISLIRQSFPTLAEAKAYIDAKAKVSS